MAADRIHITHVESYSLGKYPNTQCNCNCTWNCPSLRSLWESPVPHVAAPNKIIIGCGGSISGCSTAISVGDWLRPCDGVEAEGATQLTALDVAGNLTLSSDYKFLYAKVEDLTVGDVARLLHDYKGLALQYESLSRGVAKVLTTLDARL